MTEETPTTSGPSPWLRTALSLLIIPIVAFLAGLFVQHQLEARFWADVEATYGWRAAVLRQQMTLADLCREPELADWTGCTYLSMARGLSWTGGLTGLVALGLLAYVADRAKQARRSLDRLPDFFRAAVRAVGLGSLLLGLAYAGLVAATIFLVMAALTDYVCTGLVLGTLLLGGYAALRAAKAALSFGKPLEHQELAVPVTRAQAPALWRLIDDVARHIGATPPDHLIIACEPTCYAIEVPVRTLTERLTGRTLCLSLPLLYLWDEDELRAVVAHELAHFHGADTRYSREYAPAFRSAVEAVGELQAAFARDRRALPALPLVPPFAFTVERFALAAAAHSREREFAADAVAARVASGPALATALLKVASAVPAWALYLQRLTEQADGPPPARPSPG